MNKLQNQKHESKYYCADCKKETGWYVSRCYECKVKWYDSMEDYVYKVDHEDIDNDLA